MINERELDDLVRSITESKKYRAMGISESTVRDILQREFSDPLYKRKKDALKVAKRRLHRVIAPYLGDPDYDRAEADLEAASRSGSLRAACTDLLRIHDSTRERLEIADEFYGPLFAVTGTPKTILDVACALHPLFFPWMGLDNLTLYAYDIHQRRVEFLNRYVEIQPGLSGAAIYHDVLIDPPQEEGDVALIFKEVHRMEDRRKGCVLPLLQALKTRWILVSLPPFNLNHSHDLREAHRKLLYGIINGQGWRVIEIEFANEMVFCIEK